MWPNIVEEHGGRQAEKHALMFHWFSQVMTHCRIGLWSVPVNMTLKDTTELCLIVAGKVKPINTMWQAFKDSFIKLKNYANRKHISKGCWSKFHCYPLFNFQFCERRSSLLWFGISELVCSFLSSLINIFTDLLLAPSNSAVLFERHMPLKLFLRHMSGFNSLDYNFLFNVRVPSQGNECSVQEGKQVAIRISPPRSIS